LRRQPVLELSEHAVARLAQRCLSPGDVAYVVQHGKRIHCAGAVHYFLGKHHIPESDRRDSKLRNLEGTTVLVSSKNGATVITVYRNRRATKSIRRKAKYYQRAAHDHELPLKG
jgi:hypothetical protein